MTRRVEAGVWRRLGLLAALGFAGACSPEAADSPADGSSSAPPGGTCIPFEAYVGYTTCLQSEPQIAWSMAGEIPAGGAAKADPPPRIDHRPYLEGCLTVHDQGGCGWCTAHATTGALESYLCRDGAAPDRVSEPHLWSAAGRDVSDCPGGMYIHTALQAASDRLLVRSALWPYSDRGGAMAASRPSAEILETRGRYGTHAYTTVAPRDPLALKQALAAGANVVYAVPVFRATNWDCLDTSFLACLAFTHWGDIDLPDPAPPGNCLCECPRSGDGALRDPGCRECPSEAHCVRGYHSVLVVGYDDADGRFRFLNSWGGTWGRGGFGSFPYDYVRLYGDGGAHPTDVVVRADGSCGDGRCGDGESSCSCPGDCGPCAGCCRAAACNPGDTDTSCGTGGGACDACDGGEHCTAGACTCTPRAARGCHADDVWWLDSCGTPRERLEDCAAGCAGGACLPATCTRVGAPGDPDYCSAACPCAAGEGDCDADADCSGTLSCAPRLGPAFGYGAEVDICAACPPYGAEPNQDRATATPLPGVRDDDVHGHATGGIWPSSDVDWFVVHVEDTVLANLQANVLLTGVDADLEVCATFVCDEGRPTRVTCVGPGNRAEGSDTCCGTVAGAADEYVAFEQDCGGVLAPGDGLAFLRVRAAAAGATDCSYDLEYWF